MLRRASLVAGSSIALLVGAAVPALAGPTTSAAAPPGNHSTSLPRGPHVMRIKAIGPHALVNPAAATPFLTYYGGRVVSNISVVQVIWGTGSVGAGNGQFASYVKNIASPSMATFYQSELNGPYVDWFTSEYNTNTLSGTHQQIGRGSFAGQYVITPNSSATSLTDAQIQTELDVQIAAHNLPQPTADGAGNNNTYYAIYFPHGDTITQGGLTSCAAGGFYAYHGTIAASGAVPEIYYGVHPDMQAGSGCDLGLPGSAFANQTSVASHELVETITDPEVGLASVVGPPVGWYDSVNGEIGDICNGMEGTVLGSDGLAYTVQYEYSNTRSACALVGITPNVTSAVSTSFTIGSLGTFNVTSTGEPKSSLSETGALPSGVTFIDNGDGTATLSGTSASGTAGIYPISIKAANGVAPDATQSFTLTVGKIATKLAYTGTLSGTYGDPATVSATLLDSLTSAPVVGAPVVFTIGTQQVTFNTNSSGVASGPVVLQVTGSQSISAAFAGNGSRSAISTPGVAFTIGRKAVVITRSALNPRLLAGTVHAASFVLRASVKEIADGSHGDISQVPSVTFRLVPVGGGTAYACSTATAGNSLVTSGVTRLATCTFGAGVALGVYEVQIGLGSNPYYSGGAFDVLVVANPAVSGASGAGSAGATAPAVTAVFGFRTIGVAGTTRFIYITSSVNAISGAVSRHVFMSGSVTSLTFARTIKPYRVSFSGVGLLDGVSGYPFSVTGQDTLGTLNDGDRFTLVVTRPVSRPALPPGLGAHLALVVGDIRVH